MKSGRPRPRSLTKAELIEENERLRERLARAQGPGLETSGTEEAERLRRELVDALEQQTATAEILRVISSSPTDVQPVFDVIAENAARLCEAQYCFVYRFEGQLLHFVAHHGLTAEVLEINRRAYPIPPSRKSVAARAVLERSVVQIPDVDADPDYALGAMAAAGGYRSATAVPILRDGLAIGSIAVTRAQAGLLPERQIALLRTFADQAVIAIENVRLFNETKEALEQQTATSEILRVISQSQTDVQPVFDAIVSTGARLCEAAYGFLARYDGTSMAIVAHSGATAEEIETVLRVYPMAPTPDSLGGRTILERAVVHIPDVRRDPTYGPRVIQDAGWRTGLGVPLLREGTAIGLLGMWRRDVRPFSDRQIELLKTFADQAGIAIENVRLFNETKEALEQQTATSEILKVISASPTDIQPVFDIIAANAARLCVARDAQVLRVEGDVLRLVSAYGSPSMPPVRAISRGHAVGRAVIDCQTIHVRDMAQSVEEFPETSAPQHGVESLLAVPLLREDVAVGVIRVSRTQIQPFTEQQIALLQTFADQAVIAIENVRLFTELQASNRELRTALDTQTATSDILRVISRSQTDVRPVFDAIAQSAVRLLSAYSGALTRLEGEQIHLVTFTGVTDAADATMRAAFPQSIHSAEPHALVVRERVPMNIADTRTDARLPEATRSYTQIRGYRSWVLVPLIRHAEGLGAIGVTRREPGGFTDEEIALLQTFADQAVIAIENARLLTELQARTQELTRSVDQLTALGDVGRAVSSSLDLETVLTTIVSRAVELSGLDGGVVFEYDEIAEEFVQRAQTEIGGALADARRTNRIRKGEGVLGRTAITLESVQVPDITVAGAYAGRLRENLIESGIRAILAVPMIYEGRLIGCLGVTRNHPGDFPSGTTELLNTFATQSALAIQNARLFREIEEKSRQLEVASQHKSEFLANMSHELRTPLNAIIGFSEVLGERMFGELNEKQEEYLKDIHASGQHLLSLINDILDLSKIEAGRMELELTDFNLPATLDNALTLVRERAGRRGIALGLTVDERLEQIRADERKVRQVVLNLLSNAIKFTPEGGRIEVRIVPVDGSVEISVSDTGGGIAPEDQEAIFEEFRQVGTAAKKVEGTGLGLALSRKFVELHGGRIWVKSELGSGSTFTFAVPIRRGE